MGRTNARIDSFTAGVEVVALDRSRLLRDVANALGDQGVNILSCETITGDDRVAKMRFEFEMSNPAHLDVGAQHDQAASTRCTTPIASCPAARPPTDAARSLPTPPPVTCGRHR